MKEPFSVKASPKTLKQQTRQEIWEEYENTPEGPNGEDSHLYEMLEDKYVSITNLKEWLTKIQKTALTYYGEGAHNLITKLIEELNNES